MNPIYYDIALFLQANGFGTLGTDLFGGEWGDVDAQTLVLEGVATPTDLKDVYENPSVQILVRGNVNEQDYLVYRKAYALHKFMLSLPENVDANGTCYKGFEEGSNLAPLGKDENQRFTYSMNYYTWRNPL